MTQRSYHLGLIGYPLDHSLSPRLHNAALSALGLAGEYLLYPITPLPKGHSRLMALMDQLRAGELDGLNVTIPHKQNVMPFLDALTPTAQVIGAVNTLFRQDERLVGDNTDAPGFYTDLGEFMRKSAPQIGGPDNPGQTALLLGAGGSARAVAYALLEAGWNLVVAARHQIQTQELIDHLEAAMDRSDDDDRPGLSAITLEPDSIRQVANNINLIVNTTPLGMSPDVDPTPWPWEIPFPSHAVVYDLVYNPPETTLVRAARTAGLPATTGLGMLVEQAALSFERWTNYTAPRQIMWQAVSG